MIDYKHNDWIFVQKDHPQDIVADLKWCEVKFFKKPVHISAFDQPVINSNDPRICPGFALHNIFGGALMIAFDNFEKLKLVAGHEFHKKG